MSNGEQNPFRLDALDDLGHQLRAREGEARGRQAGSLHPHRPPAGRKRIAARVAVVFTASLALLIGLNLVSPAGASSPVSRSPREAEKAGTVRFVSNLEVAVAGRKVVRFAEKGGLDFASGDFETSLTLPPPAPRIDRRRVGGLVFIGEGIGQSRLERWQALRLRTTGGIRAVAQPGGFALTDPQVILRVLGSARGTPVVVGHAVIDGQPVTGYVANTTLLAFLQAQRRPLSATSPYEPVHATLHVWLDEAGRPVRVEALLTGPSRLGAATTKITSDFSHYGEAIVVTPPPGPVHSGGRTGATGIGGDPIGVLERILFSRP
jgi:hypothetical protein